jgi:hypothetical protein
MVLTLQLNNADWKKIQLFFLKETHLTGKDIDWKWKEEKQYSKQTESKSKQEWLYTYLTKQP